MKVICIKQTYGLTIGKSYSVIRTVIFNDIPCIFYCVYDDNKNFNSHDKHYVIPLKRHRLNILNQLTVI